MKSHEKSKQEEVEKPLSESVDFTILSDGEFEGQLLSDSKNRNHFLTGVGLVGTIYSFVGIALSLFILLDFYSVK